ncbi:MAG: hypothetical protein V4659_02885 [Pseudomonadota bacterium]
MDQAAASTRIIATAGVTVSAPHTYDGIGQALRCAFRNHRDPPPPISTVLRALYEVD